MAEEWIRGRGWDHTKWSVHTLPSRPDLNAITARRPAIFTRVDGHICVVNAAALEAAGITKETPDFDRLGEMHILRIRVPGITPH